MKDGTSVKHHVGQASSFQRKCWHSVGSAGLAGRNAGGGCRIADWKYRMAPPEHSKESGED